MYQRELNNSLRTVWLTSHKGPLEDVCWPACSFGTLYAASLRPRAKAKQVLCFPMSMWNVCPIFRATSIRCAHRRDWFQFDTMQQFFLLETCSNEKEIAVSCQDCRQTNNLVCCLTYPGHLPRCSDFVNESK